MKKNNVSYLKLLALTALAAFIVSACKKKPVTTEEDKCVGVQTEWNSMVLAEQNAQNKVHTEIGTACAESRNFRVNFNNAKPQNFNDSIKQVRKTIEFMATVDYSSLTIVLDKYEKQKKDNNTYYMSHEDCINK